ncbi:MAG TPA: hypothetical protein EYP82_07285 [Hydrogenothermaceae bacterium]|nr:hypothetical protein [Hydrogenothermaceae bacterium]
MIRKSLLPLLLPVVMFAVTDLGIQGKTYDIQEKSIKELILEGVEKLDKEELKKKYLQSIDNAFTSTVRLPASNSDSKRTYVDYVVATYDVPDPNNPGEILYRKGERIASAIPEGVTLNMCFIDGNDREFAVEVVKEFGKCDYLVANEDIRKVDYLGSNLVFPMGRGYIKRFGIKKLPAKLIMFEDKITKIHLDMKRIAKEIRDRK